MEVYMSLTSLLYDLTRLVGKAASVSNDARNISNGRPDLVVKKQIKREMYKNINKIMRKF